MSLSAVPVADERLPSVTALATAGGLRAINGGSLSTHKERDLSLFGGSVTLTLGTADDDDRPSRNGSFFRRSMVLFPSQCLVWGVPMTTPFFFHQLEGRNLTA